MTTVELKRLSSLSLSPLYSVLNDAVSGLAPIRAHRFVERYCSQDESINILSFHQICPIGACSSNGCSSYKLLVSRSESMADGNHSNCIRLLCSIQIRLSIIAVVVVSYISFAAVIQHRLHFVDSGMQILLQK